LESDRAAYERERAADDRFLRAVELLGHETDQARVGALHALVGVARSRPSYTQDVLDVICSYLRRPFEHPEYAEIRGVPFQGDPAEADRWRVVRLTAQRCLADLLPKVGTPDAPAYDLDLTGATLEYCELTYRVMGQVRLRGMKLYQSNSFHHSEIHGTAWFTDTETWGRLHLRNMVFHDDAVFNRVRAHNTVLYGDTVFHGAAMFKGSTFNGRVDFHDTHFDSGPDFTDAVFTGPVTPPSGWSLEAQRMKLPATQP
jgi:Pentapeptide repeats (9 copies)